MEALWQDVAEETADKFICCERHDLVARSTVGTIIFVVERDDVLVERNQSAIGDGNTEGVARQISKDRLGAAERALRVDVPFASAQRREVARERLGFGEMGILVEEMQLSGLSGCEELQHQKAD